MTLPNTSDTVKGASALAIAKQYSGRFRGFARFLTAHRPRICPFKQLIDSVPKHSSVLDIGCGNGLFLYMLARTDRLAEGIGIDIRSDAVISGNAALKGFDIGQASLHVAGATSDWPKRTFEAVSMIDVMHHVPRERQRQTLAAALAMVAPGGIFIYKDIATSPAWTAWANRFHDLLLARQWIHYLPISEVDSVAMGSEMRIVQRESVRLAWYAHELRVFRRAPC